MLFDICSPSVSSRVRRQKIRSWYTNYEYRMKNAEAGALTAKVAVKSLVNGAVRKRRSKQKAIHAYHNMKRVELDAIIDPEWAVYKDKNNITDPRKKLAFRNERLASLLEKEDESLKEEIDRKRQSEVDELRKVDETSSEAQVLLPRELLLPAEDRQRILIGRQRHQ